MNEEVVRNEFIKWKLYWADTNVNITKPYCTIGVKYIKAVDFSHLS